MDELRALPPNGEQGEPQRSTQCGRGERRRRVGEEEEEEEEGREEEEGGRGGGGGGGSTASLCVPLYHLLCFCIPLLSGKK